ncbi:MAG: NAD(P)-binding domain-containing protein [Actinobacteria bacterium]|nr:NAD(P)-binding domain-containing protein [Actinomycetota bacterium]
MNVPPAPNAAGPSTLPRVCVIGAGSSGIAASKQLHQSGIPFDCFEKATAIGGLWNFGHDAGHNAAYRSLHINTSRQIMEFSDYPMPESYPDYPSHSDIAEYFADYVDHFGFRDKIQLGVEVERAERRDDGVWLVTLSGGETREYDALVVANGHHWDPRWPEPAFPGNFDGVEMHSHDYVDQTDFAGKNVIVLGMGNSAMDIAVETSTVADNVYLAARSGVHIVPKYAFGKPFDHLEPPVTLPWPVKQKLFAAMLRTAVGKVEDYGLPKPAQGVGEAHPTVSSDILSKVGHGFVKVKPNIAELQGDKVRFTDGSVVEADIIVYCTGYKVTFPFFDEDFISAPDNDLPLYRRVFKPGLDNAFFVGLLQPLGAIMPLAEAQSRWISAYLKGQCALPSEGEMRRQMEAERAKMFKRYTKSKRHTMQVDFREYLQELKRELDEGAKRAQGRGLPVPPRAGSAVSAG